MNNAFKDVELGKEELIKSIAVFSQMTTQTA